MLENWEIMHKDKDVSCSSSKILTNFSGYYLEKAR